MNRTRPTVLVVTGPLAPGDVGRLWEELSARLRAADAVEAVCDVSGIDRPTLATVDSLARLRLAAHRRGCRVRLSGVGQELRLLLDLTGLAELAGDGTGQVETSRVAEARDG